MKTMSWGEIIKFWLTGLIMMLILAMILLGILAI